MNIFELVYLFRFLKFSSYLADPGSMNRVVILKLFFKSDGYFARLGGVCLIVQSHQGLSITKRATPSSYINKED